MAEIRDRRELPFFQVRFQAVAAIRDAVHGRRRLRAVGCYALLCQLANEQRHTGEHRSVRVTYEQFARRGQLSKRDVKLMLEILTGAGVVRYERLVDPERGATISILHLLIHDGQWTPITVAMALRLAQPRAEGHLLRDLGMIVVLLEFCAQQREAHGGLQAQALRTEIAQRTGLTVDGVDDANRALERAGMLEITRRRGATGGRYLANIYTIIESQADHDQGGETVPTRRSNGTGKAEHGYRQGGQTVLTRRPEGTGKAEHGYRQGGVSANPGTEWPPSYAHTRDVPEKDIENTLPPDPHAARVLNASSAHAEEGEGEGEGKSHSAEQELCEALIAAWEPVVGDGPRRGFERDHGRWLTAAGELLARHPRKRLALALDYMVSDEILGSETLTMPGFAKLADKLLARAHARQLRLDARRAPGADDGLGWPDAKAKLERAIRHHGREGRQAALRELGDASPLLPKFVERVRWSELCERPIRYVEREYAELWAELAKQANPPAERAA